MQGTGGRLPAGAATHAAGAENFARKQTSVIVYDAAMETDPSPVVTTLERRFAAAGLDLVQPFDAARYNERIAGHPRLAPLPLFGRDRALGVLVGNTGKLWPRFIQAYRSSAALQAEPHPLDRWVIDATRAAVRDIPAPVELRFSHDGGPRLVSMLDAAAASGLAQLGPVHLAIHPDHGPWLGLRVIVVIDREPPPPSPPPTPCEGCAAPCEGALSDALAAGTGSVAASWQRWVAVRDACPVGRASRYGEAQLRYHYTKDRRFITEDDCEISAPPEGSP